MPHHVPQTFASSSAFWWVDDQPDERAGVFVVAALRDDYDERMLAIKPRPYNPCKTPFYWMEFDSIGRLDRVYKEKLCIRPEERRLVWDKNFAGRLDDDVTTGEGNNVAGCRLTFMRRGEQCSSDLFDCDPDSSSSSESSLSSSGKCGAVEKEQFERIILEFDSVGSLDQIKLCESIIWRRNGGSVSDISTADTTSNSSEGTGNAGVYVRLTSMVYHFAEESSTGPISGGEIIYSCSSTSTRDPCTLCCKNQHGFGDVNCGEMLDLADLYLWFDSVGRLKTVQKVPYRNTYICGRPTTCCPDGLAEDLRLRFQIANDSLVQGYLFDFCLYPDYCNPNRWTTGEIMIRSDIDCTSSCEKTFHEFVLECESAGEGESSGSTEGTSASSNCRWVLYWNGTPNRELRLEPMCCETFIDFHPMEGGVLMLPNCVEVERYEGFITESPCMLCITSFDQLCTSASVTTEVSTIGPP